MYDDVFKSEVMFVKLEMSSCRSEAVSLAVSHVCMSAAPYLCASQIALPATVILKELWIECFATDVQPSDEWHQTEIPA
jgi:hypothetical protein